MQRRLDLLIARLLAVGAALLLSALVLPLLSDKRLHDPAGTERDRERERDNNYYMTAHI